MLDGILLAKIKEELNKYLPLRIYKINSIGTSELQFNVHSKEYKGNLLINCNSNLQRLYLSKNNKPSYEDASSFVMLLRKYLINGVINEIKQKDYDRYLIFEISAKDELYDLHPYQLVVELMGKYTNVILVDKNTNKIIDALKRIPLSTENKRTIISGIDFPEIESQNKKDPFVDEVDLNESLVKQFSGFSKLLENEVRYRLNSQSFKEILEEIKKSSSLYISEGENIQYHIIPLTHLQTPYKEYELFQGFEYLYSQYEEKEKIKDLGADLFKLVKRQQKHFQQKIIKLQDSYQESLNPDKEKLCGELLFTYANLNQKGLESIEIDDYEGNKCLIKLNPKLSVKENANKYFQAYHKKKKGLSYIEEQLNIANNELEYFNSLSQQLEMANAQDIENIKSELQSYSYLKTNTKTNKKKKQKIHLYQCKYKDYTITFGKNNIQNDYLSFKYGKSNNMWFHAKDFHGCHLIVDTAEPDEECIRFCANLAAYYSKGRNSSSVPVDYCLLRDVKKIKGAKAGFVSIRNQKTIYIDPEFDESINIYTI